MKRTLVVLLLINCSSLFSQWTPESCAEYFYDVLNQGDSSWTSTLFAENSEVIHLDADTTYRFDLPGFLGICSKFKSGHFREEILHVDVTSFNESCFYTDVYFKFYLDGKYHHCGIDHIVFTIKKNEYPEIEQIYSTYGECYEAPVKIEVDQSDTSVKEIVNDKMNDWHANASKADFDNYFGFMAADFFFLGTDPKERWSKKEFSDFCEPYFDKGKAWSFTTNSRNWYFSEDGNTAWFDESLETWMLECRGSGVLQKIDGEWKLYHYNLTVLIENEKMDKFIKLRKK